MNKKMITISAAGLLLVAALGFGIYKMLERTPAVPITDASASTQPEIVLSSESEAAAPAPVSSSSISIPPIVAPSSSASAVEPEAKPAPQPNVVTSAPNGDGGKDVAVSRPEYSRPPDDETIYDEPKDKDNGSSTPDAPQGGNNNGNTQKPEEKPQGGNGGQGGSKPGQIYVPGFGWMDDEGGGESVTIAENAGTGDVIGQ